MVRRLSTGFRIKVVHEFRLSERYRFVFLLFFDLANRRITTVIRTTVFKDVRKKKNRYKLFTIMNNLNEVYNAIDFKYRSQVTVNIRITI